MVLHGGPSLRSPGDSEQVFDRDVAPCARFVLVVEGQTLELAQLGNANSIPVDLGGGERLDDLGATVSRGRHRFALGTEMAATIDHRRAQSLVLSRQAG